ncbi:hypothetical protein LBMAG57_38330 [Verrucomicrobiota bacterium]|nr:hypothetical protein LBMAG57_38330 [Verrucomicrobiota bacterium]
MTMSHSQTNPNATTPAGLVNAERCLCIVFPDPESRPSLRYFRELQAKRLIPWRKIGRLTFFDAAEVRRALDKQFTVQTR